MHPLLARSGIMGISTNSIVFYQLSSGNYIDNDVHNNVSIIFFHNWTTYIFGKIKQQVFPHLCKFLPLLSARGKLY